MPQAKSSASKKDEIAELRERIEELEAELSKPEQRSEFTPNAKRLQERDDEIAELRERIEELETEVSRPGQRSQFAPRTRHPREREDETLPGTRRRLSTRRDAADSLRDTTNRTIDESGKLIRGLTLAYLEQVRSVGEVLGSFADAVFQRNEPEESSSVPDLVRRLPGDLYSGYLDAVERFADIPGKTVDRLYTSYNEAEDVQYRREPKVQSISPEDGEDVDVITRIAVKFDKDIRPEGRDFRNSITVQTDSGTVDGIVARSGPRTLIWTPDQPLDKGTYRVKVSGIESDEARNRSAMRGSHLSSFTIAK